ncbi:MAG: sulfatase [Thermoanaerobaculales bacterium]|jgi:arylsulfatase A-like enzyme|nr:sulfatase [Thermoanaerobaculales bacterium]
MKRLELALSRGSCITILTTVCGLLLIAVSACSPQPEYWTLHQRWIEDHPTQAVDLDGETAASSSAAADAVRLTILADEARPARCSVPGDPWRREVVVPPGAKLRFGYGAPSSNDADLDFQARVGEAGSEETVAFTATVPTGERELWSAWNDAEIDLSSWSGKTVTITLGHSPTTSAATDSLGCWSNPEVVAPTDQPPPPNVVLISLDTLRADGLSLYGNPRPTSPNIDRWAEGGVVFRRAVAPAPWTLPSHTSMFTGVDATRHGASHNSPAPQTLEMLAEILRANGYATAAVTGGAYLHPQYGLGQGIDSFKYWPDGEKSSDEVDAVCTTSRTLLQRSDNSPFFLLIHTYEVHNRGRARVEFFREHSSLDPEMRIKVIKEERVAEDGYIRTMRSKLKSDTNEKGWVELPDDALDLPRDIYDSRVNYADQRLAPILDLLSSEPLRDNTIVVLTSDHGEMLGEHGLAGHIYLYDENLIVPLIVAGAGIDAAGVSVPEQVRSVDIVPTILDVLGIDPSGKLDGRTLMPLIRREDTHGDRKAWSYVATSNRGLSLTTPGSKFILNDTAWSAANQQTRFFDLTSPRREAELGDCPPDLSRELTSEAASKILESLSGTRLRFTNNLEQRLVAEVHGSAVTLSRVKSMGAPGGTTIDYVGTSTATLDMPPGADFTVFLQDTKAKDFTVRFHTPDGNDLPPWEGSFNDSQLGPGRIAWFTDGAWHNGEFGPEIDDGDVILMVLPDRSAPTAFETPEDLDPELRKQLEALGYL